jgi:putative methyltransferase (TIGR04325 family)
VSKADHVLGHHLNLVPVVRAVWEKLYERRFTEQFGTFRGVFHSFEEARRSAPEARPVDFNCLPYAHEYEERRYQIYSFDYPILFWLRNLLFENCRLFDYGGHVGAQFYSYSKYLKYPCGMKWLIYDLPLITRAGEELLQRTKRPELSFTNQWAAGDGSDILIAAGCIQYVESPRIAELLAALRRRPRHLLINKIPLYDGPEYVTLQNGGVVFSPQYVFNRTQLIESLKQLGYQLVDSWNVETHHGQIPFHPEQSFPFHSGLYLALSTLKLD